MAEIREFTGEVTEKRKLTEDVIFFSLKVPSDFSFKAGQYVFFKIKCNGEEKVRAYSILNPPSQKGMLDFVIKIIEGGFASQYFGDMKVGDKILARGPFGHFTFDSSSANEEHWFICSGTGIAPVYSMLKEHFTEDRKYTLLFGVKYEKDLFLRQELKTMDKENDNFTFVPTLTREEWSGKTGRVHRHLPEDASSKTFYICGLKEMVLETKEALLRRGVSKEDIKFERYS